MADMVIDDYLMTMSKKPLGVAEFKAHLSEYLRKVRRGEDLVIYDREQPVARVTPYEPAGLLTVREARRKYRTPSAVPLPPPIELDVDPVELLLEDRRSGR